MANHQDNYTSNFDESGQGVTKEYVDIHDGLLGSKIEAETSARAEADANLKAYVDSKGLEENNGILYFR